MSKSIRLAIFIIALAFLVDLIYHISNSLFLSLIGIALAIRFYMKW